MLRQRMRPEPVIVWVSGSSVASNWYDPLRGDLAGDAVWVKPAGRATSRSVATIKDQKGRRRMAARILPHHLFSVLTNASTNPSTV
mgnify:CR=1 FL=1